MYVNNKTTFDALKLRLHAVDMISGPIRIERKNKQKQITVSVPPNN